MVTSPVPPARPLVAPRPGTGADAAASTEPSPAAVLPGGTGTERPATVSVPASAPEQLPVLERAALAVRSQRGKIMAAVSEVLAPFARLAYTLMHPESMGEHRAYVKSREWVHPEITGRWAAVFGWGGILYHLIIARPLMVAADSLIVIAKAVKSSAQRPLRFLALAVPVVALIVLLARYL